MSTSPRIVARRADARAEILDAAWELAREEGLVGLSLRKLAKKVGMQAPSLYAYFDNKDAIYDGMFELGFEAFDEQLEMPDVDEVGAHAALAHVAREYVEFCNADPVRFQLLFQHAIPGWHPSPDAYAPSLRSYDRMVAELAKCGVTSPDAIDLFTALTTGLAHQQLANDPGGDRWLRLIDDAVAMFLAHNATNR